LRTRININIKFPVIQYDISLKNWHIQTIGKGAAYLYLDYIVSLILGYAFWLIISKVSSPEIIGISSTIVSFSAILAVVAGLGIPRGVQRFLGRSFSEENYSEAKRYVNISIVFVSIAVLGCTIVIVAFQGWMYQYLQIDSNLLAILIVLSGSQTLHTLFRSVVVSTLKTKVLPITLIVSSIVRIISAIMLLLLGWGVLGITIGYTMGFIVSSILLSIFLNLKLKSAKKSPVGSFSQMAKNILASSTADWIPALVTAIGAQIGTVIVFGVQGSQQAGLYFIALILVSGITVLSSALLSIAFPVLSSMQDGRKRFAWRVIRLTLVIAIPFSTSLIFYSKEVVQLIGQDYVAASFPMQILLLSLLPTIVASGISYLVYAYGHYKQVLIIGLATNVPRALLYRGSAKLYYWRHCWICNLRHCCKESKLSNLLERFGSDYGRANGYRIRNELFGSKLYYWNSFHSSSYVYTIFEAANSDKFRYCRHLGDITWYCLKSHTPPQPNYRARFETIIWDIACNSCRQNLLVLSVL
jgi:O-antigen/teichoic acid export membrane protein